MATDLGVPTWLQVPGVFPDPGADKGEPDLDMFAMGTALDSCPAASSLWAFATEQEGRGPRVPGTEIQDGPCLLPG